MARISKRARDAGLDEDWKVALLDDLLAQADRGRFPSDVASTLALYLDAVDLSELVIGAPEAAEILGVTESTVRSMVQTDQEWMHPAIMLVSDTGRARFMGWFRAKVEAFRDVRAVSDDGYQIGWRRRRRRAAGDE